MLILAAEENGILFILARSLAIFYLAAPSESPVTVLLTVSFQEAFSRPCQNLLMSLSALTTPRLLRSDRLTQPEHPGCNVLQFRRECVRPRARQL